MATGIPKVNGKNTKHSLQTNSHADSTSVSLSYKGKQDARSILNTNPPKIITAWPEVTPYQRESLNRLYYGDNLPILSSLLRDPAVCGKVRLIYIDPPFATNSVFQTRDQNVAYSDLLAGPHSIEFLRKRLIMLRELLADNGSIYIHLDENMAFHIKIIMDEIFGKKNFRNWITRKKCNPKNYTRKTYGKVSDFILFYTKTDSYFWRRPVEGWTSEKAMKEYQYIDKNTGRRYKKVPIHAPGVRNGKTGTLWKGMVPPPGKHWQYTPDKLDEMDARGEIYWSPSGNPRRKVYLDESQGVPVQDIWLDFRDAHNQNIEITGYPTEKNQDLLARIIAASSIPGDLVLDCFCGSGTTLTVASKLGRHWIGIDNSQEALTTVLRRFALGTKPMGDFVNRQTTSHPLNTLSLFESLENLPTARNSIRNKDAIADFTLFCAPTDISQISRIIEEWRGYVGETSDIMFTKEIGTSYEQPKYIHTAIGHLSKVDRVMAELISEIGDCRLYKQLDGFEALAEAIIRQQLSKEAAQSIMTRIRALTKGKHLTQEKMRSLPDKILRKAGLSSRKLSYLKSLQKALADGSLDLPKLQHLSDEEAINALVQVRGIGRWTAEMYLIFVLLRPDVFPLDDGALRKALCQLYNIKNTAFLNKCSMITKRWSPFRSIASWYLWAYLNKAVLKKNS